MATLHEYFVRDGATNLTTQKVWPLANQVTGEEYGKITARLHLDFEAFAKFISFYIPEMPNVACPEALALNEVPEILVWPAQVAVRMGVGEERVDARDLIFTGQIYIYSERQVPEDIKIQLINESVSMGHHLTFRSIAYTNERNRWERPKAFISHDSRDKQQIAEPIALQLQRWMCPVWFDQYSLNIGDSLRESIESGLRDCSKCILILTKNFLSNEGWGKREYDSIFTRELVEKKRVVLPVWYDVTPEDVYRYSPILADRVGAQWSEGVENVARKLLRAIDQKDD